MNSEIEKLLDLGRMDLEAGYPEYARQYFEKVLALDATNQEAREAIVKIEAMLSRKVSFEPKPELQLTKQKGESTHRFQRVTKRIARLFGTLAVFGGLLFVLPYAGVLLTIEAGTGRTKYPLLLNVSIVGLLAAFLFGALWFACWTLGKLWKAEG
jgi:hypothetical protein